MRTRFISTLTAIVLAASVADAALAGPSALSDLLDQARQHNPALRAARQRARVLEAERGPAGAWPNPTVGFIDERDPSGLEGVEAERIRHYNVSQTVPFPGKLSSEALMKRHEARLAESEYRAMQLEVFHNIRREAYRLYTAERAQELTDQGIAVMKSTLRSAQARLAGGQTSTVDVFMAQTELRRMENLAIDQRLERESAQIELDTLLGLPTTTAQEGVEPPDLVAPSQSLDELLALAAARNPIIQSGHHERAHSETRLRRSRLEYAPDFGLFIERQTKDAGPAGRQLGLSLSVPLWVTRPAGSVRAAEEHRVETEAQAEAREREVRRQVHWEYVQTMGHLQKALQYRDAILPGTDSTLRVLREQYASGRVDFLKLLEGFRAWVNANLEFREERRLHGEHLSLLEKAVGVLPPEREAAPSAKGS